MTLGYLRNRLALERWLQKQTHPVKWTRRPEKIEGPDGEIIEPAETGRIPIATWRPFTSIDDLPRGVRLQLKADNDKRGTFCKLPPDPPEQGPSLAVMSPELVREHHALQVRKTALDERERGLDRRQRDLLDYEARLLRDAHEQLRSVTDISRGLDARSKSIVESLESFEEQGRARIAAEQSLLAELDAAYKQARSAEERNEIATSMVYGVDRLLATISLWKLKRTSQLTEDELKEFQEFLKWKSAKRYSEHMPDVARRFLNDFLALSPQLQEEVIKTIIQRGRDERQAQEEDAQAQSEPQSAEAPQESPAEPSEPTRAPRRKTKPRKPPGRSIKRAALKTRKSPRKR